MNPSLRLLQLLFLLVGVLGSTTVTAGEEGTAEDLNLQRRLQLENELQQKYANRGYVKSREDIIAKRRAHKQNLRNMVKSLRKQLSDHSYGSITLTTEEKERAEYNVDVLQRKVDTMEDDVQDFEVDRILEKERKDYEKRMARSDRSRGRNSPSNSDEQQRTVEQSSKWGSLPPPLTAV